MDCKPSSNPDLDSKYGPWVKMDRPLDPNPSMGMLGEGSLSAFMNSFDQKYIFYRRSRRSDVRKITDIRLVEEGSERPDGNLGWHRCKIDLRTRLMTKLWGKEKPLHLYFKTFGGEDENFAGSKGEEVKVSYDNAGRPIFAQGAGYGEKDPLTELDIMVSMARETESSFVFLLKLTFFLISFSSTHSTELVLLSLDSLLQVSSQPLRNR